MKLLLVDDDAFLRDMYATKFTEAGFDVAVAKSGQDALTQIANEGPFDLVLMDMVMPGMTGVQLIEAICEAEGDKRPKCVVLSNQGEQSDIAEAKRAGAVGYIVKAESIPSEVVKKVQELIG